jgi:hypothetical protein
VKTRILKIAAFAGVTVLVSSAALAYVLLDPPRRWFDTPRLIRVDNRGMASVTDSDNGVSQAVISAERWNGGGAGNVVDAQADVVAYVLGDGISDIIFGDPLNICKGTCLAATTVGYYDTDTQGCCDGLDVVAITDSDVAYNLRYDFTSEKEPDGCSSEFYLEAVNTHEVGHVIGLGHSADSNALMYASIAACHNKPLHTDDINGRDALYDCTSFSAGTCGGGGGGCTLKQAGESCTANSDCCSNNCKGRPGGMTCK